MPREILLVEDDDRFVSIVTMLLEEEAFRVRHARDAREARASLDECSSFGMAIVDLGLPDASGVDLVREFSERARPIPVLVLTGVRAHSSVVDALRAGASGYLYKHDIARRLVSSIDELFAGGMPLSTDAAKALVASLREASHPRIPDASAVTVTTREHDVLRALARGLTYEQIGLTLDVSENTVRTHVRALYRKLDVCSRTEAVVMASRLGLVTLS